jgi:hypothetical protein
MFLSENVCVPGTGKFPLEVVRRFILLSVYAKSWIRITSV